MGDSSPRERLQRRAQHGFRGYPMGTVAFYGPDDRRATKVAVGIVNCEGGRVRQMEKWLTDVSDVRTVDGIIDQFMKFLQRHHVKTVVVGPGILGCPHEEGIDYPEGEVCPQCPFWAGRQRPIEFILRTPHDREQPGR